MMELANKARRRWHKTMGRVFGQEPMAAAELALAKAAAIDNRISTLDRNLAALRLEVQDQRAEALLLYRAGSTTAQRETTEQPPLVRGGPGRDVFGQSTFCRESDFSEPWFTHWSLQTGVWPRYHRKLWEYVFICQSLYERDQIVPGSRGLGFGVGEEVLSSLFAAHGCDIVATDLGADGAVGKGWIETAQHARDRDSLRRPDICPDPVFDERVTFQACDMNAIDPGLREFDFCWSSCAFEHLGSIAQGLDFVENSIECLKPGGWAVHTTEFNLFSNADTVDHQGTVLFRRQDFEALERRLALKGHRMATLNFDLGDGLIENVIDVPPYSPDISLRIAIAGFATTSFGLIIQRGPTPTTANELDQEQDRQLHAWFTSRNVDERRHAAFVSASLLKDENGMTSDRARRLHQACLDAALKERDHDVLALELQAVADSPWPLIDLGGGEELADFAPLLPYQAAVSALTVLERLGDPSYAERLEAGLGARTIYPYREAERLIARLRTIERSASQ